MPIYQGISTKNKAEIIINNVQMQKVYVGDRLVWQKPGVVNNDFITEWNLPSGDFTFPVAISALTYDCVIDWGDGSSSIITAYNDADLTHSYASAGTYQIKVSGTLGSFYINNGVTKLLITKVINWGNVGMQLIYNGFYGASNLTEIPNGPITGMDGVSSGSYLRLFYGTGLTSIPANLFAQSTWALSISYMFYGTPLTGIPAGLFTPLSSIVSCNNMFHGCSSLTGASGGLWLNPGSAANYNLISPNYNSGVPNGNDCYRSCAGLSDYATIPTYWK